MNGILDDGWARRIFFFASPEDARFLEEECRRLGVSRSDLLGRLIKEARARARDASEPKAASS